MRIVLLRLLARAFARVLADAPNSRRVALATFVVEDAIVDWEKRRRGVRR